MQFDNTVVVEVIEEGEGPAVGVVASVAVPDVVDDKPESR